MEILKFDVNFEIVDSNAEERMVYGYASTVDLDKHGDIVTLEALKEAIPTYMSSPELRVLHMKGDAAKIGSVKKAIVDHKGLYIGAKVANDSVWNLVKMGVLKAFSVGIRVLKRVGEKITKLELMEISLVDTPANVNAKIDIYKSLENKETPMKDMKEKISERADVDPKEGMRKYGKVKFADPKNKKYPIDTPERIRAAWNYIHQERNAAKYSSQDVDTIKKRILRAWKDKIGGEPPSAEKATTDMTKKGMNEVACLAQLLASLDSLEDAVTREAGVEQDNSTLPTELHSAIEELGAILRNMTDEETEEMANDQQAPDINALSQEMSEIKKMLCELKEASLIVEKSENQKNKEKEKQEENKNKDDKDTVLHELVNKQEQLAKNQELITKALSKLFDVPESLQVPSQEGVRLITKSEDLNSVSHTTLSSKDVDHIEIDGEIIKGPEKDALLEIQKSFNSPVVVKNPLF